MKTDSIWKDKTEKPVLTNNPVRICFISHIQCQGEMISRIESMKIYNYDCESELRWKLFTAEEHIEKWCYMEELLDL